MQQKQDYIEYLKKGVVLNYSLNYYIYQSLSSMSGTVVVRTSGTC